MSEQALAPLPTAPRPFTGHLSGLRKAAVLLVALGPERAAEVMRHLREDEIETLSLELAKLRQVPAGDEAAVLAEMVETAVACASLAEGGVDFAREVLERSIGSERATEIIGRLYTVIEMRPFEFLRRTPPEQIATFLRNEAPQTVAMVVANLHTTLAARVLGMMPDEMQGDVALRIATMAETSPDVLAGVENVFRAKLANVLSQEYSAAGGVKTLAEILNHTDRPTERNVLDSITDVNPELGEDVRRLLFVFEDIVRLDDRSIQLVLRDVDQKDLALALRGVTDEVKERVLSNMSERGAEMLREEIEYQPPQRKRVVQEAQGRIVGVVRRLEEAGAIVLSRGGEDEVL